MQTCFFGAVEVALMMMDTEKIRMPGIYDEALQK
jgi:hypothetical protein